MLNRTIHSNLSFVLQVTLVGHNNNRERVLVLYSEDLLVEGADLFEGVAGCNGVHEEESLASSHILFSHGPA